MAGSCPIPVKRRRTVCVSNMGEVRLEEGAVLPVEEG